MRAGMRIRRVWKAGLLLAVGAAGGGAALAVASVPDSNGVIYGCYAISTTNGTTVPDPLIGPNLRIIDPGAGQQCDDTTGTDGQRPTEAAVNWNQVGLRGPRGVPGRSATVVAGNTLTIRGGTVITVAQSSGSPSPLPIPYPNAKPIGTVTLALNGGTTLVFKILELGLSPTRLATAGAASATDKPTVQDIQIIKVQDQSTPKLLNYCVTGKHFTNGTIVVRKAGGQQIVYKLTNVTVSSYQAADEKKDATPVESLSLNFTKIEISNKTQ